MTTESKPAKKGVSAAFLAQAGKGRTPGTPNKVTAAAKSVIAEAAEKLGGVDRLVDWAKEDPENETKFWATIYPKLIPVQVTGEDGKAIQVEQVKNDADAFVGRIAGLIGTRAASEGTGGTQH